MLWTKFTRFAEFAKMQLTFSGAFSTAYLNCNANDLAGIVHNSQTGSPFDAAVK
jgi:hypothetical protein